MAGERLEFALQAMEQHYVDLNCREYELTKKFSLRLQFLLKLLKRKTCSSCEVDIHEWMFDLDQNPSYYMRHIKKIALSIACVTCLYTGMHCSAQLLSSAIRYKLLPGPELATIPPVSKCHCEHDPFVTKRYSATETIALSEGIDDDGLFELNF
jgi:hypothetical protein